MELAGVLQKLTESQPERFGRLALKFPEEVHPYYFSHVLAGLKNAAVSFELKLAVARRVFGLDHRDCLREALALLGSAESELPIDAIQFIQKSANHTDPETELWDNEKPYYGGDILTHGINSVRGWVAESIRDLLFTDPRYLTIFSETIAKLAEDRSLAVRAVFASTLIAIAYRDTPMALRLFDTLSGTDDRLLGTAYVQELVHKSLRQHWKHFVPTMERMLRSTHAKVREAGGILACLARLYHEEADFLSKAALSGDEHCRLGACEVAKSNLLHAGCRPWCEATLMHLFVDGNHEVRCKAAGCFWYLWQSPETALANFDTLIRSSSRARLLPTTRAFCCMPLKIRSRRCQKRC